MSYQVVQQNKNLQIQISDGNLTGSCEIVTPMQVWIFTNMHLQHIWLLSCYVLYLLPCSPITAAVIFCNCIPICLYNARNFTRIAAYH